MNDAEREIAILQEGIQIRDAEINMLRGRLTRLNRLMEAERFAHETDIAKLRLRLKAKRKKAKQ